MTTSQGGALARVDDDGALVQQKFTQPQIDLIKTTILDPKATDDQLKLFVQVCQQTGLNPFAKQIYGVIRKGRLTIQTGIDGFRLIAERTGRYAGRLGPWWCGADGVWHEAWLENGPPAAAKVGVRKTGVEEATYAVARFKSFYQSGGAELWDTMPEVMIAKVAEAQALRALFPQELSGLYTSDEMAQAGTADAPHGGDRQGRGRAGGSEDPPPPAARRVDPNYPPGVDPAFDVEPNRKLFAALSEDRKAWFKAWCSDNDASRVKEVGDEEALGEAERVIPTAWNRMTKRQCDAVNLCLTYLTDEQAREEGTATEEDATGDDVDVQGGSDAADAEQDPGRPFET